MKHSKFILDEICPNFNKFWQRKHLWFRVNICFLFVKIIFSLFFECAEKFFFFLFCLRKRFFHFFKLNIVYALMASYFIFCFSFIQLSFPFKNKIKKKNFKNKFKMKSYLNLSFVFCICSSSQIFWKNAF
jgi:hypothetical protein